MYNIQFYTYVVLMPNIDDYFKTISLLFITIFINYYYCMYSNLCML